MIPLFIFTNELNLTKRKNVLKCYGGFLTRVWLRTKRYTTHNRNAVDAFCYTLYGCLSFLLILRNLENRNRDLIWFRCL